MNFQCWKSLDNCLGSLYDLISDSIEVIVVDNCSPDNMLPVFEDKYPWVDFYLNTGNCGFSSACNAGAEKSEGEYLLFLNPDIIANAKTIRGMLRLIQDMPGISILSCRLEDSFGKAEHFQNLFPSMLTMTGLLRAIYRNLNRSELSRRFDPNRAIVYPDWVSGSVILISKIDFEKTGRWNENYWMYYEDVDLCLQLNTLGGIVALSNEYSMIHNHGGASRIDSTTASLTKSEVIISKHVFISCHYSGIKAFIMHIVGIGDSLVVKFIPAMLSIPFWFSRKLSVYQALYIRLVLYYINAIKNRSWLSERVRVKK